MYQISGKQQIVCKRPLGSKGQSTDNECIQVCMSVLFTHLVSRTLFHAHHNYKAVKPSSMVGERLIILRRRRENGKQTLGVCWMLSGNRRFHLFFTMTPRSKRSFSHLQMKKLSGLGYKICLRPHTSKGWHPDLTANLASAPGMLSLQQQLFLHGVNLLMHF